jgi:uncharacterized protein with ParB-like and HNH nuclease domain
MSALVYSLLQTASTLHDGHVALVIPSYQRPYVWPSEDVVKLLDDIIAASDAGEPHYYIGTVLTAAIMPPSTSTARVIFELIDGQQRMTTLILLALAFSRILPNSRLAQLAILGNAPRLTFAIRDQVQTLLGYWAGLDDHQSPGDDAIKGNPYLTHLAAALKGATSRLENLLATRGQDDLDKIGQFLFRQVKWVNNVMPAGMDLNRLFATMNTSGVQLEQSDILKSRLLHKITQHKARYDAIWQACENMDNYFERNLRQLFPTASWQTLGYDQLAEYSPERFPLQENDSIQFEGLTIAQLAAEMDDGDNAMGNVNQEDDDNEVYCRSIISFSMLLMHTYRIFRKQKKKPDVDVRLNETRLNDCFDRFVDKAEERDVVAFIECLWQVRYQFDRWVVKWVERAEDDEEQLRLSSVSRSKSRGIYRLNRSMQEASNLTQLQSVRNFTGERSAQYWLTPFLGDLVAQKPTERVEVEALLERIDNQLSLAQETQKEASYALLGGDCLSLRGIDSVCRELQEPKGTGFEHYWFQKLEYILWREQNQFSCFKREKLDRYRITSKNSVEHVHPQREEHGSRLEDQYLHAFGNLVLLSPGENSSYSNQSVLKKRADFLSKPKYDSLKLAHFFGAMGNDAWDTAVIERHQETMLQLLEQHYRMAPVPGAALRQD